MVDEIRGGPARSEGVYKKVHDRPSTGIDDVVRRQSHALMGGKVWIIMSRIVEVLAHKEGV